MEEAGLVLIASEATWRAWLEAADALMATIAGSLLPALKVTARSMGVFGKAFRKTFRRYAVYSACRRSSGLLASKRWKMGVCSLCGRRMAVWRVD
jgi:hypothetical protein